MKKTIPCRRVVLSVYDIKNIVPFEEGNNVYI